MPGAALPGAGRRRARSRPPRITSAPRAPRTRQHRRPRPARGTRLGRSGAGVDAGSDRRRPRPGPLRRLRPAEQRADAALPERVAPALPRGRPQRDRRPVAALPLRRRPGGRRRRPGGARGRVPGRDRRRARALGRLRLRGLAEPLPLEPRRRPGLGPLRRGRIPGDRDRDPGRAARDRRPAGAAGADGAAAADRRPRRPRDGADPRGLPRRLLGAALDGRRGRRGAGARLPGGRRLRDRRGRGRAAAEIDGEWGEPIAAGPRPGLLALAEHPRHEAHSLVLRPTPGLRVWSLSFAAGAPG